MNYDRIYNIERSQNMTVDMVPQGKIDAYVDRTERLKRGALDLKERIGNFLGITDEEPQVQDSAQVQMQEPAQTQETSSIRDMQIQEEPMAIAREEPLSQGVDIDDIDIDALMDNITLSDEQLQM